MKKGQFKSQASSSRAASGVFGVFGSITPSSSLSHFTEPPDLSNIGNPHVVVAFKNLNKKDESTRSKSLQDLRLHINAQVKEQNEVEDSIIEAWINVYPRLSIDSSRVVRDLSHSIQYELLSSSQKRMSSRVSRFVGSWLAGRFDRDRTVASNVKKTMSLLLPTNEKLVTFYKRHHAATLSYAYDAFQETPETLSDERSMSKADMWAKYFIVLGSIISLVLELLKELEETEISKLQENYNQLLSMKKLWNLVSCDDMNIRRAICELLVQCCMKQRNIILKNLDVVVEAFIIKGLLAPQTGSASNLNHALRALTIEFPEVWELNHRGRKSHKASSKYPLSELKTFISGSPQLEVNDFWKSLQQLIISLPVKIIPNSADECIEFLENLKVSISRRGGIKFSSINAWNCYLDISEHFITRLTDRESKLILLQSKVFPIFDDYLKNKITSDKSSETFRETFTNEIDIKVALKAYKFCLHHFDKDISFPKQWEQLGTGFIERIETSLSEGAKKFHFSQDSVLKLSQLWFSLLKEVLEYCYGDGHGNFDFNQDPLFTQSIGIVQAALTILISQEGKSYCAAGILENAISLTPELFTSSTSRLTIIEDLLTIHLPKFFYSPSATFLIPTIFQLRSLPGLEEKFESIWQRVMENFLSTYKSVSAEAWIGTAKKLISDKIVASLAQNHRTFQRFLLEQIDSFIAGNDYSKQIINAALDINALSETSGKNAINSLIGYLDSNHDLQRAIFILKLLNGKMHNLMDLQSDIHADLILKLLVVKENALLEQGTESKLSKQSQKLMNNIIGDTFIESTLKLIKIDLQKKDRGHADLFVGHLIKEAKQALEKSKDPNLLELLLPSTEDWLNCLNDLLDRLPGASSSAASCDLGSIICLIKNNYKSSHKVEPTRFGMHGLTMPLRKAIYTAELLFCRPWGTIPAKSQMKLLETTLLTLEVAESDEILQNNHLFSSDLLTDDADLLTDFIKNTPTKIQDFVSDSHNRFEELEQNLRETCPEMAIKNKVNALNEVTSHMWGLVAKFISLCELCNPVSYYAAKALNRVLRIIIKLLKSDDDLEDWLSNLSLIKNPNVNILGASAILVGIGKLGKSSKTIKKLCNQLVSNLFNLPVPSSDTIGELIILNSCLSIYDYEEIPVAQNRLVFSVQHIVSWIPSVEDHYVISEIFRLLQRLLPSIKDIYGSFWESCIKFCISTWVKQNTALHDENVAVVVMSIKLFSILKEIEDPNEDLIELFIEFEEETISGLLELLFVERSTNSNSIQAADETLAKLIFSISSDKINDIDRLYPLLASDHFWIQSAAYYLIHKRLPAIQQQLSVDIVLENKDASLPPELLSLIITSPNLNDINLTPEYFKSNYSQFSMTRSYLIGWLLVFETFAASSYKVRSDLNNVLKSYQCVGPLIDFIFKTLGQIDEKLLDHKKIEISSDKIRQFDMICSINEGDRKKNLIEILVSLYFQSLKYAPSSVKSWWLDTKKQTKNNICIWTEKFISPLLIEEELNAVIVWAENQDRLDDDQNLIVKVARNVREVSVGYEIDDMVMQFLIRVPENYPLDLVKVESVNRVGISEQKWTSFLMTTNGVINFSNGSISDSLFVFRKNIISALKGQVECAICYSIISVDRKVPDKKCGTCHNIFHSKCLFQWFKSSNQSNCPLCRNTFNY